MTETGKRWQSSAFGQYCCMCQVFININWLKCVLSSIHQCDVQSKHTVSGVEHRQPLTQC